jgi:hypothetical protein
MRFDGAFSLALLMLGACTGGFDRQATDDTPAEAGADGNPTIRGASPSDAGVESAAASEAALPDAPGGDAPVGDAGAANDSPANDGALADEEPAEPTESGPSTCAGGALDCSGTCVSSDVHDCGTCGHDCTGLPHVSGATSCTTAGACSFPASACAPGWADCDGNPDNGCEQDITTPASCGACGNVCPADDPVCGGGACVTGCPAATPEPCGGTCVNTASDPGDCDGCGHVCPAVPNGQPTCASSTCGFTCNSGFSGCPTSAPTSCVDEATDPTNCGACGKSCPGPTSGSGQPACAAGACTLDCSAGLTACPTAAPTECANTTDDTTNCGGCGDVCPSPPPNAQEKCTSSKCGFTCDAGFLECNGTSCIGPDPDGLFVSPSGSATAGCTAAAPCSSIGSAIAAAGSNAKTIYLDQGTYSEQVALPANITIVGGWTWGQSAGTWTNCNGTNATSVISAESGAPPIMAMGGKLDTLTVVDGATATAGQTLYGVLVTAGAVTLNSVAIQVNNGGAGHAGTQGSAGGAPDCATASSAPSNGLTGAGGVNSFAPDEYIPGDGAIGTAGTSGNNGSPGQAAPIESSCGLAADGDGCGTSQKQGGPGTGGCGGGGGGGGTGGSGGGASIGVYVAQGGSVTLSGSTSIQTGAGGSGGQGGAGGTGAVGSPGATGTTVEYFTGCEVTPTGCKVGNGTCGCSKGNSELGPGGAAGGTGGAGGNGGAGGGGAGGDSVCYAPFQLVTVSGSLDCVTGTPGVGGLDGNGSTAKQGAAGFAGVHN